MMDCPSVSVERVRDEYYDDEDEEVEKEEKVYCIPFLLTPLVYV